MTINRRNFLGTAVSGAALAASGGLFSSFYFELFNLVIHNASILIANQQIEIGA